MMIRTKIILKMTFKICHSSSFVIITSVFIRGKSVKPHELAANEEATKPSLDHLAARFPDDDDYEGDGDGDAKGDADTDFDAGDNDGMMMVMKRP